MVQNTGNDGCSFSQRDRGPPYLATRSSKAKRRLSSISDDIKNRLMASLPVRTKLFAGNDRRTESTAKSLTRTSRQSPAPRQSRQNNEGLPGGVRAVVPHKAAPGSSQSGHKKNFPATSILPQEWQNCKIGSAEGQTDLPSFSKLLSNGRLTRKCRRKDLPPFAGWLFKPNQTDVEVSRNHRNAFDASSNWKSLSTCPPFRLIRRHQQELAGYRRRQSANPGTTVVCGRSPYLWKGTTGADRRKQCWQNELH